MTLSTSTPESKRARLTTGQLHRIVVKKGFELRVVDENDQPLAGVPVRVTQGETLVIEEELDAQGCIWIEGHTLGSDCEVHLEGRGALTLEGGLSDEEGSGEGELPEYDPGPDEDGHDQGC